MSSQEYDYIIVGGGTAGCVLASRLTANENNRVLVLEAGTNDYKHSFVKIPAGVLKLFKNEKFDWNYECVNEKNVADRSIYLCRGKILGGSSCANVLLYHRGNREDYEQWQKITGDEEWGPEKVLPYFKKSEDYHKGPSPYHGIGGEYSVDEVRYQNPLSKTFLEACAESGYDHNPDFNDWSIKQEGFGRYDVNEKNGARSSAASGFLDPVLKRKNLDVLSETFVNKIIFDESGTCVTGVEIVTKGEKKIMHVKKDSGEVLLTAGAINSPQLLMLSGIGPKNELDKHHIPIVKELPGVGQNLQDHPAAIISYKCSEAGKGLSVTSKIRLKGTTMTNPKVVLQWLLRRSGPLTSTGCDHGGFFKSTPELSSPDVQMRFIAAQSLTADGMGTYTKFREASALGDGFSIQSIAARPYSRGHIELASTNPQDKPLIHTGYLSDEGSKDIASIREGIKLSRQIVASKTFDEVRGEEVFPGKDVTSDQDIDQYIRESTHTSNAVVGTCKMGSLDDPHAVVDTRCRVKGISGLRVIDASVMPKIPGGQTGAPTIMIAEKAADFLMQV